MSIKSHHRFVLALIFIFALSSNAVLYSQGPNAPEAGAFEPVDATDMVNLVTGDLTYVLPLMNIPSPEGGYPIALAYHAGIALDQEASWVGLGWGLNPGAINRSVNGFPDDYENVKFYEFFYDEGGSETYYNLSVGYGIGATSIGLGFSWGTNKSLGGSISLGFGPAAGAGLGGNITLGSEGSSIGIGYTTAGALSFGASLGSNGTVGANIGVKNENGSGFSISGNSAGGTGIGFSMPSGKNNSLGLNFSFSDNGVGITGSVTNRDENNNKVDGGIGVGVNVSFNNTINKGDYTIKQSGFVIPVVVPIGAGYISASFGKQKVSWFLNKAVSNNISGPIYFNENITSVYKLTCLEKYDFDPDDDDPCMNTRLRDFEDFLTWDEANAERMFQLGLDEICDCTLNKAAEGFMDVHEISLKQNNGLLTMDENNVILPSMDNYIVQAQGLSGNMALKHFENASLYSIRKNNSLFSLSYSIDSESTSDSNPSYTFQGRPDFYFENDYSSYLATSQATFWSGHKDKILDYLKYSEVNPDELPRRKLSKHIEYFTNEEIWTSGNDKFIRGYVKPLNSDVSPVISYKAIGAYTITGTNGKKYHYSIPVYNYATVTRTFGMEDGKIESKAYFEKIQEEPYATHWLLTAITGPDYIDVNGNGSVDNDDYGYWVEFDYGKWSEAFAWKTPYGKDFIESNDDENVKTRITGYKDVYYLDQIKTRTHTAIFSKKARLDSESYNWNYKSVDWIGDQDQDDFESWFTLPNQKSLRLDKIILLKNEDAIDLNKNAGDMLSVEQGSVTVQFPTPESIERTLSFNREDFIYNASDIPDYIYEKAIKVIDLNYRTAQDGLVKGTPNTTYDQSDGRLTLESVNFKGKKNTKVLPPYRFDYHGNNEAFTLDNENDWGYNDSSPWAWSLKSILTPEGSEIGVTYESDDFHKPALQQGKLFTRGFSFYFQNLPPTTTSGPENAPEGNVTIRIERDSNDNMIDSNFDFRDYFEIGVFNIDMWFSAVYNYNGPGYSRHSIDIDEKLAEVVDLTPIYMIVTVPATSPFLKGSIVADANPFSYTEAGVNGGSSDYRENQKLGRYELAWVGETQSGNHRYSLQYKIVGNKSILDQTEGDIRVQAITTTDGVNEYKTEYLYNQLGYDENESNSNYRSSGGVSFIPHYKNSPIPYSSELPAPKVMYEYVTVKGFDANHENIGKTIYHFNILKDKTPNEIKFGNFFEIATNSDDYYDNVGLDNDRKANIKTVNIYDNLASIGQLLDVKTFNTSNQLISKVENEYFSKFNRVTNQGVDVESYQSYKEVNYFRNGATDKWLINGATRYTYAQALKTSKTISGGNSYITNFDSYDSVTGATIETITNTSNGNILRNKTIPAFYKYPEMGSKVDDINNKNMMSQAAGSYTLINDDGIWKPIGVGVTTWNKDWSYPSIDGANYTSPSSPNHEIWRKHKTYVWDGEIDDKGHLENYNLANDDGFTWNYSDSEPSSIWKKVSETTNYDHFSLPLQLEDINGNYASTKMDIKNTKVFSTSNAAYTEQFYSGAEDTPVSGWYGGHVKAGNRIDTYSHTGIYSESSSPGDQTYQSFITPTRLDDETGMQKFKLSVWVRNTNNVNEARVFVDGEGMSPFNGEKVKAGNWIQLNHYFEISQNRNVYITSINGELFYDDVRIHPIESSMTSYVYNEYDELSFLIGANNLATKYQYDDAGRLLNVFQETIDNNTITGGFKKVNQYRYNYKRDIVDSDSNPDDPLPGGDVFIYDRTSNDGTNSSTAKIQGDPGAEITLRLSMNCLSPLSSGGDYGQFRISNNGAVIYSRDMGCGEHEVTDSFIMPSNGYVQLSITHTHGTNSQRDPQDRSIFRLHRTNIGQITGDPIFEDLNGFNAE